MNSPDDFSAGFQCKEIRHARNMIRVILLRAPVVDKIAYDGITGFDLGHVDLMVKGCTKM